MRLVQHASRDQPSGGDSTIIKSGTGSLRYRVMTHLPVSNDTQLISNGYQFPGTPSMTSLT